MVDVHLFEDCEVHYEHLKCRPKQQIFLNNETVIYQPTYFHPVSNASDFQKYIIASFQQQ